MTRPLASPRARHPALKNTPAGQWCPEAVGKVRGYPKTQEAFDRQYRAARTNLQRARAAGRMNRRGVPNGWAGRRAEIVEIEQVTRATAARITGLDQVRRNSQTANERLDEQPQPMARMRRADFDNDREWHDAIVKSALAVAFEIAISPLYPARMRAAGARLFLDFTMPKPAIKVARQHPDGVAGFLAELAQLGTT